MIVKTLDCTLRDGGYVNSWNFGKDTINKIVTGLSSANIDFIEIGFLKYTTYDENKTLFNTVDDFKKFIPKKRKDILYLGMITFGEYNLDGIPMYDGTSVDGFRIIFKKNQSYEALSYCKAVVDKGYKIFINPMHTYSYSDIELLQIVEEVNKINPMGLSIVDTMGIMRNDDIVRTFLLIDNNLNKDVKICFHSHNNLQLSFSNALALMGCKTSREVVIDSTVFGMGRGAGNLCTELFLQHINDTYASKYNLLPILKIIDEHIQKIFAQTPWGYSVPFYLAAGNACHPNYASYLIEKQTITVEAIHAILSCIPEEKKLSYDVNLVKQLYLDYQENEVDDTEILQKLKEEIADRPVLILGSGKTIVNNESDINTFIENHNPFIVSINFTPEMYKVDKTFIGNAKRFSEQTTDKNLLITSNIKTKNLPTLNYGSYLNSSELYDNSALMLCKVLIRIGVEKAFLAGMDGFTTPSENYYKPEMINNAKLALIDRRNNIMKQALKSINKQLTTQFITPSLYVE